MWTNEIYLNDIKSILNSESVDYEKLKNKSILVTGATGIIGSMIVNTLLIANKTKDLNCHVIAMVRNKEKADSMYNIQLSENINLEIIKGDIKEPIIIDKDVNYIIHAASETSSKKFISAPLEIIDTTLKGVTNVLNLAKEKNSKTIFLSTMEVYGRPETDEKISEEHATNLMTNEVRNCYPISKRMAENICFSYSKMYNLDVDVLRLTQTFGPGVNYNDGRVFADFARCAIEGRDIILHTKGETKRSYLYLGDAVNAILTVLTNNKTNEIYNVANENTYCSIYEMANLVADKCSEKDIKVKIELEDIEKFGFAKTLHMNLDTKKILSLGWKPTKNLEEMFKNLINTMR